MAKGINTRPYLRVQIANQNGENLPVTPTKMEKILTSFANQNGENFNQFANHNGDIFFYQMAN